MTKSRRTVPPPEGTPVASSAPKTLPETPVDLERQDLLSTLKRLGFAFAQVDPRAPAYQLGADLWVHPPGTRSALTPVFLEAPAAGSPQARAESLVARWSLGLRQDVPRRSGPGILVVASDETAELTGQRLVTGSPVPLPETVARTRILVLPSGRGAPEAATHWHPLRIPPRSVLLLATGILVGLAERAQSSGEAGGVPLDVEGMFQELRRTFHVDVEGSLGVAREEDAMFLLYQLALRETYAPGDQGASLHELVNDPKGPAARLPWFAI